eukprot:CAMPEP_0206490682 /NCGR_PEP_ID=MMETSP0324_2-20121206/44315_1 /ASSEMBLY_ACC=CAM_ASM_000836 /TAXON_ID=2866 /ORGANISM="Crypthecodinium cohnii, Strain Seligo" /LENGTH=205 /DNA_ID=CAMNT_0053971267 /DNA_START=228 /DNA_END=842 /DNA_ORIENTATION=-
MSLFVLAIASFLIDPNPNAQKKHILVFSKSLADVGPNRVHLGGRSLKECNHHLAVVPHFFAKSDKAAHFPLQSLHRKFFVGPKILTSISADVQAVGDGFQHGGGILPESLGSILKRSPRVVHGPAHKRLVVLQPRAGTLQRQAGVADRSIDDVVVVLGLHAAVGKKIPINIDRRNDRPKVRPKLQAPLAELGLEHLLGKERLDAW